MKVVLPVTNCALLKFAHRETPTDRIKNVFKLGEVEVFGQKKIIKIDTSKIKKYGKNDIDTALNLLTVVTFSSINAHNEAVVRGARWISATG